LASRRAMAPATDPRMIAPPMSSAFRLAGPDPAPQVRGAEALVPAPTHKGVARSYLDFTLLTAPVIMSTS